MQRPNFFNDQLVLDADLNYILTAVSVELLRRIQGNLGYSGGFNETALSTYSRNKAGILGSPGDSSSNKNLKVTEGLASNQLLIYPGSALNPSGELIYIDASQTLQRGITTVNYSWTTVVGTNYVKLSYMETSGSVKTDDLGNSYPTRYTAGWFVNIDGTVPTSTELLLATFTGDGSGNVTASSVIDTRLYTRVYTFADAVGVDPYNTAVSSIKTVGEHLRATGSASPTANNPHGISYADLGGNSLLLPINHATNMHVSSVIPYVKTTASFNSYKGVVVNPTSNAYVTFTAPDNAVLVVGGQVFSGSLTSLYAIDAYNISGNGDYYAVVDNTGATSWKLSSTFTIDSLFTDTVAGEVRNATGHKNPNYYIICKVTVADNGDDISAIVDSRLLYGTQQTDIGADYSESVLDPNSVAGSLTRGSTLLTNLSRMRYQLGKAINGTGSLWSTTTYPLTAGPSSNAGPYHSHNFVQLLDVSAGGITFNDLNKVTYPHNFYVANSISYSDSDDSENWYLTGNDSVLMGYHDVVSSGSFDVLGGITFDKAGFYVIDVTSQMTSTSTTDSPQSLLRTYKYREGLGSGSTVLLNTAFSEMDGGINRNRFLCEITYPTGSVNQERLLVMLTNNFKNTGSPVGVAIPKNTNSAYPYNNSLSIQMISEL